MEKTRGKSKDFGSFAVLSGCTISLCSALVIGLLELSCSRSKSPDTLLTLNDSARLARDTIAADHVFYLTQGIGFEGRETPQFRCSDVLGRNCNTEQLEWLARNDSSYIVRLCAYRQLRRRSGQHAVAIFREFFRDTTSVKSQSGCCGSTSPYGEALQSINTFDRNTTPLTIEQQNTIDSLLFFENANAERLTNPYFLEDLQPLPLYYPIIRREMRKGNYAPVVLLAKYKQNSDFPLINAALQKCYQDRYKDAGMCLQAINCWPNVRFQWFVKRISQDFFKENTAGIALDELLSALLCYPEPWSYQLIERLAAGKYPDAEYTYFGITLKELYEKRPHPFFKPLYKKYAAHIKIHPAKDGKIVIIEDKNDKL
ncbi:MAG: hypothetical protein D8B52_06860 [Prevotella sp.]|nr:MAG: hypothetical protein D8B52_06860 [Prevotella sp.]